MFFGHRVWVPVLAQTYELRVSEMVCSSPGPSHSFLALVNVNCACSDCFAASTQILLIPELPKPDRRTKIVHASEVSESVARMVLGGLHHEYQWERIAA